MTGAPGVEGEGVGVVERKGEDEGVSGVRSVSVCIGHVEGECAGAGES